MISLLGSGSRLCQTEAASCPRAQIPMRRRDQLRFPLELTVSPNADVLDSSRRTRYATRPASSRREPFLSHPHVHFRFLAHGYSRNWATMITVALRYGEAWQQTRRRLSCRRASAASSELHCRNRREKRVMSFSLTMVGAIGRNHFVSHVELCRTARSIGMLVLGLTKLGKPYRGRL